MHEISRVFQIPPSLLSSIRSLPVLAHCIRPSCRTPHKVVMVVLDNAPGIHVSVVVDNNPLDEYDDDEKNIQIKPGNVGEYQAAHNISKYIDAVPDKEFTVRVVVSKAWLMDTPTLAAHIKIDGNVMARPIIEPMAYEVKNGHLIRDSVTDSHGVKVAIAQGKWYSISQEVQILQDRHQWVLWMLYLSRYLLTQ